MNSFTTKWIALFLGLQTVAFAVPMQEPVSSGTIKVIASSTFSREQNARHLIDSSSLADDRHDNDGGARTMWHTTQIAIPNRSSAAFRRPPKNTGKTWTASAPATLPPTFLIRSS